MKYSHLIFIVFSMLLLAACQKKELPVKPHDPGNAILSTVDIGSPYKYQIYFSLKDSMAKAKVLKTSWDIGFEVTTDGYHVVLNTAKAMYAFKTAKTDFLSVSIADTAGFNAGKKWDEASGNMDSTAVGDWRDAKSVYIMDRGYDENGAAIGLEKVQFLAVTDVGYTVRFSAIDGTGDATVSIVKDSTYNLAFLSFTTGQQTIVEPPKTTWDLAFTQYTYIFYDQDPPMPYLVTGCMLNRYHTTAALDNVANFAVINSSYTAGYNMSADISTIGYTWKTYTGSKYIVNDKNNYIIHTSGGYYYKLHFTGYYNKAGKEGNPAWEYQLL